MKNSIVFLFLVMVVFAQAQQLNCTVQINTDKVANTNAQLFTNMKTSITDFVNKTDWTGEVLKQHEKINCSMVIIINSFNENNFSASIQVQSTRPIYNSTYDSPVFNYNDTDFGFRFTEFELLVFNPATFDSNLVSVLSYYSYMILAFDGDTFALKGGTKNFELAQQILTTAQQGGYKGWSQADGNQNRFFLINDIMSGTFDAFRDAQYAYHRAALDRMTDDAKIAKENVLGAIDILATLYQIRPNAFLTRVFFDAKADEIVAILSGGPNVTLSGVIDNLNRISPLNSSKWATIKL
jgi:hypothetical protein